MNRELFISLGITILTGVTLFLYFRNRFKMVEHKVNTIFQLVQKHAQAPTQCMRGPMPAHMRPMHPHMPQPAMMKPEVPVSTTNLIEVSDDEYSDSDDESESDGESHAPTQNIILGTDIKQVSVTLGTDVTKPTEINLEEKVADLDDVDSLTDDADDADDENDDTLNQSADPTAPPNYAKLTVSRMREIAAEKGFTNYKKLRKAGLIELLSN